MSTSASFYYPSIEKVALRQGEIFSNVLQLIPNPGTSVAAPAFAPVYHSYAILLSQDCDLASDDLTRQQLEDSSLNSEQIGKKRKKLLKQALFCEMALSEGSIAAFADGGSKDTLKKNDDFRYHILQAVTKEADSNAEGIPSLIVNFKQLFTVPMEDLLIRIASQETRRRCCMNSHYFEHVSNRFTYYIGRIGLPQNHLV